MDLGTADQLLSGQQLVVGEHLPEPGGLRHLHFGRHRQWHRPGRYHSDAEISGGIDQYPALMQQVVAQSFEGLGYLTGHLDHAALQLGGEVVREVLQQFGRTGGQPPRRQIDEVKFLFHAHGSRRLTLHPLMLRVAGTFRFSERR